MQIVSAGPLPVASTIWSPTPHALALTLVCRATFRLVPVEAELAADQDAPTEEDAFWNDDPSRSLSAPSDLAPFKRRADVILVGYAFAPRGQPARSLVVRLKVGEVDKSLEVFGERSFSPEGLVREGPRFLRVPLQWERAAGGPETSNPVGMRLDVEDRYGATPLPQLQPCALHVERRGDAIPPVGFGPIAPSWPSRRELLGPHARAWSDAHDTQRPIPADLDAAYFNAAPRDQQLDELRDDELLVLENLHPDHPRLVTSLPGIRPRAWVERGGASEDVAMRADTLWIDTGRAICTLTWRGRVALDHAQSDGRIVVELDESRRRPPMPSQHLDLDAGASTLAPQTRAAQAPRAALPFVTGNGAVPRPAEPSAAEAASDAYLDAPDINEKSAGTVAEPVNEPRSPLPFVAPRQEASFSSQPPPPLPRPTATEPVAPRVDPTPWAVPQGGARRGATVEPVVQTRPVVPALRAQEEAPGASEPPPEEAASPPRARTTPRDTVKVVWFDPAAVPRIRKQRAWRRLLADLDLRLLEEAEADVAGGPLAPEARDRRTVLEVLLAADFIGPDGVKSALEQAVRDDGGFEPPLGVLHADLELRFDESELLKATALCVRPLAGGDKRVKETLDLVDQHAGSAALGGAVAESLTAKLRDAFGATKRALPVDYLEANAERMLLEQRAYQRRALFGKKWVRSVVRSATGAIPVYLPEEMKDGLPLFRRFRARMLAELDQREDEGETSAWAVRVLALARVIPS